jgi:hypothetical protein
MRVIWDVLEMVHLETITWILGPLQGMSCRVVTTHQVGRQAAWDVTMCWTSSTMGRQAFTGKFF